MTISPSNIEIQSVHRISTMISRELIKDAILAAYEKSNRPYDFDISVNIRIVGREEGTEINKKFKKKNTPTNVLAFLGDPKKENDLGIEVPSIGDIVVCYPVVQEESDNLKKTVKYHFVHMVIHGFLHLLGYDHQDDHEEYEMNELTNEILQSVMP
ncbi:MAG TPA: rRNA maturation RNase YbeY [Gammaproteobacteria bacterium]|nr:rRNA maturation RNase YbeY [Gammaproteobacteria bacterium]|tara:strand:- start:1243 stop:1710 length:468 start_codon:yes stop_codon:yes gene_type:complete